MGLVLFLFFAFLCFVLPLLLYQNGKVSRLTVDFWLFFGFSALVYGEVVYFLNHGATLDPRVGWIGPGLAQIVFAVLIYFLERKNRTPISAIIVAFFGSFLVTGLWLMTSIFFLK
jgi:hypothetical protein